MDLGGGFDLVKVVVFNRYAPYTISPYDTFLAVANWITTYRVELYNTAGALMRSYPLSGDPIQTIDLRCPSGLNWLRPAGSTKCYKANPNAGGYIETLASCASTASGATLASVTSDAEADFVFNSKCGGTRPDYFLGARKTAKYADRTYGWEWADGSSTSWLHTASTYSWLPGQPDDNGASPAATTPREAALAVYGGGLTDWRVQTPNYGCCALPSQPASTPFCSVGLSSSSPATSCYAAYSACNITNRVLWIRPVSTNNAYQALCVDDGWTLAMKITGETTSMQYDSTWWTSTVGGFFCIAFVYAVTSIVF